MGKQKPQYSYAVLRSSFGDLWVGKIELEPNGESIFTSFDDAMRKARQLNDSIENADELDGTIEEELEPLAKEMERWII